MEQALQRPSAVMTLRRRCRALAAPSGLALLLSLPAVARAQSTTGEGMAGGITIEPPGSPLRGDQRVGLSGDRARARRGWIADVVVPSEPSAQGGPGSSARTLPPGAKEGRGWNWREGYGVLPPKVRPWFVRPPSAGDNVNKRESPVPPPSSLRNQTIEDPTLQRDP